MSINSKAKRDKKKKESQKKSNLSKNNRSSSKSIQSLDDIFDPAKLTTPQTINEDILKFCRKISDTSPTFIEITPELWSRQSCCDLNVHEYIKLNGGSIVCGYKLWYNDPVYIEGERHAVWYGDGEYRDITFNSDGEEKILFIPDIPEKQSSLELNERKIRWCKDEATRALISQHEFFERMTPFQNMSDTTAWNTMLTYENWKAGERMSSLVPVIG